MGQSLTIMNQAILEAAPQDPAVKSVDKPELAVLTNFGNRFKSPNRCFPLGHPERRLRRWLLNNSELRTLLGGGGVRTPGFVSRCALSFGAGE